MKSFVFMYNNFFRFFSSLLYLFLHSGYGTEPPPPRHAYSASKDHLRQNRPSKVALAKWKHYLEVKYISLPFSLKVVGQIVDKV